MTKEEEYKFWGNKRKVEELVDQMIENDQIVAPSMMNTEGSISVSRKLNPKQDMQESVDDD